MLGEPEQEYFALYSKFRDQLDGYLVTEEQAAEEKLPVVQLIKYDIDKLSRNNTIDSVTMILSLSEKDERIQMSVEELMGKYDWYDSEGEE